MLSFGWEYSTNKEESKTYKMGSGRLQKQQRREYTMIK
jgi:hypothetical protein